MKFLKQFFIICFMITPALWAITNRAYEPIILKGGIVYQFDHVPLENLVAYKYTASTKEWEQITFQIDDIWSNGDYAFSGRDSLLTSFDELLFLAKDFGDEAPSVSWISDESSKSYVRVEITATDPVSGKTGYVYVYRTDDPSIHPGGEGYMEYTSHNDAIVSDFYEVGHTSNEGIMKHVDITPEMGGNGQDILDRMKLRVQASKDLGFPLGNVSLMVGENVLRKVRINTMGGPIRILRKWRVAFDLPGALGTLSLPEKDYIIKYYPTSSDMGSFNQLKFSGLDVLYIRISLDMSNLASGMHFYREDEDTPAPIDHTMFAADIEINKNLNTPGWNWWMQSGTPGTVLTVANLPTITGMSNSLYYRDATSGTDDSPYSGDSYDTGEDGSWGDGGVKYWGHINEATDLSINLWYHFLGPNLSPDSAAVLKAYHESPINDDQVDYIAQNYVDGIEPAAVSDLHITGYNDGSISLAWTAPGDDGNGNGAAAEYQLKYRTTAPGFFTELWWSGATLANDLPVPASPGETQTLTVTGLDQNKNYYFILRTVDESGNWSDFSNTAGQSTTPVELAAFTAKREGDHVKLYWTTESESNNLGFSVEKKSAQTAWQEIAFVQGAGTSFSARQYSLIDSDLSGHEELAYRLKQIDTDGTFVYSNEVMVSGQLPVEFTLLPNYPNPFNPSTRIDYKVPEHITGQLELIIYDVLGRRIRTLVEKPANPGYFSTEWDGLNDAGNSVSSGEYFCVLRAGSLQHIQKMIKLQ